jgi:hypothetical protein
MGAALDPGRGHRPLHPAFLEKSGQGAAPLVGFGAKPRGHHVMSFSQRPLVPQVEARQVSSPPHSFSGGQALSPERQMIPG